MGKLYKNLYNAIHDKKLPYDDTRLKPEKRSVLELLAGENPCIIYQVPYIGIRSFNPYSPPRPFAGNYQGVVKEKGEFIRFLLNRWDLLLIKDSGNGKKLVEIMDLSGIRLRSAKKVFPRNYTALLNESKMSKEKYKGLFKKSWVKKVPVNEQYLYVGDIEDIVSKEILGNSNEIERIR